MQVKSQKNKIQFSFVGMKKQTMPIDRTEYKIMLKTENEIKEVTVTARRRTSGNNLAIPDREISYASQSLNMKDLAVWVSPLSTEPSRDVSRSGYHRQLR